MDAEQEHAYESPKPDMDVDANNEHAQLCMVENFTSKIAGAVDGETTTPVPGDRPEGTDIQLSYPGRDNLIGLADTVLVEKKKTVIDTVDGAAEAYIATEVTKENPNFGDQQNLVKATNEDGGLSKPGDFVPETAANDDSTDDAMQASGGGVLNLAGNGVYRTPNIFLAEELACIGIRLRHSDMAAKNTNVKGSS